MKNKIALSIVLLIALAQLIQPESEAIDQSVQGLDFLESYDSQIGEEEKSLIMNTCYDCHSNKIKRPWYAQISPVSWWIEDHIQEGREHLNFSAWSTYSTGKKAHKLEECYEEIEENEMPLWSYQVMHSEARFTAKERKQLIEVFKKLERLEKASSLKQ